MAEGRQSAIDDDALLYDRGRVRRHRMGPNDVSGNPVNEVL